MFVPVSLVALFQLSVGKLTIRVLQPIVNCMKDMAAGIGGVYGCSRWFQVMDSVFFMISAESIINLPVTEDSRDANRGDKAHELIYRIRVQVYIRLQC